MTIDVIFLDLDGTLYPHENGMWDLIEEKMETFMNEALNIPKKDVPERRAYFFQTYGTTLRGLMEHYSFDPEEYLAFVHDVPVTDFIRQDGELRGMLLDLPQPKWILTNSDKNHSKRVLGALGIEDLFKGVIGVSDLNFKNKPDLVVYEKALHSAGNPMPESCLFADDLPKNLAPAREMGFLTVLVGNYDEHHEADFQIQNIKDLPQVLNSR